MRSISILLMFVSLSSFGQIEVKEQVIKSPISEIKLFLTAGEMLREQKVILEKGRNKLIFSGISALADPNSIRFKAEGDYRLLSLTTEMDFLAAEQFNPRIALLNDSLESLRDQLQYNNDLKSSYHAELGVMNTNKDLAGKNASLTVEQIKAAGEYYRKRTFEINETISKLNKEQKRLEVQIEDVRFQLVELNYNENQRSNQVIVLIDSDSRMEIQSQLKYIVSDCGWAAIYDLEAVDIKGPIDLKYKAQVYNNTGNDWNNVKLTLSTGDPHLSAQYPELTPWYINYYSFNDFKSSKKTVKFEQVDYRAQAISDINSANERVYDNYIVQNGDMERNQVMNKSFDGLPFQKGNIQSKSGKNQVGIRQIEISELSTEFNIMNKFSCPSDSKPYLVSIKNIELMAKFSHVSVPKLDNAAFLMANITGWEELELMPGPTNVYFGGAYVGLSEIDTRNVSDTLSLSFGRDNKVLVMRKLKSEMTVKRTIGNLKRDSYNYEIVVKNKREVPISIEIYDQVPLSRSSDITIAVDELSGGIQNLETGEVKWNYTINPGDAKSMELGYTVKYPKDLKVEIQRFRTISCPSF